MKVLICDKMSDDSIDALKAIPGIEVDYKAGMTPEELIKTIPGYNAMVVRSATKATKEIIDATDGMKVIIRGGIGLDNIDQDAAKAKGIDVRNTPTATTNSVGEITLGLMLSLARSIAVGHWGMKNGQWMKKDLKGCELGGKVLGLIGSGRIGQRVAELALAFGMKKVIAYDPYVEADVLKKSNIEKADLDTVLKEADWISLHLPKTEETANMINASQLAKCKKGVMIVNAARGGIIVEDDIAAAIESGQVGGYATDVYSAEPPDFASSKLLKLDKNVVFTPHIGAASLEGQDRVGDAVIALVKEYAEK